MVDPLQEAYQKYPGIPKDCFLAKFFLSMSHFEDNTVVPGGHIGLICPSENARKTKWIKASRFELFVNACTTYGVTSDVPLLTESLHVVVMPYMPLEDAFLLHQSIEQADMLSDTFSDAVQRLEAKANGQVLHDELNEEEEEEEEEDMPASEVKQGVVVIDGTNISVPFTVANYSILWSKADTYCMMRFLIDPMQMLLSRIETYEQVMGSRSTENPAEELEANVEEANWELIFAMYRERTPDAHGTLLQLYPDVHDAVYLNCCHCNPQLQLMNVDDSPDTVVRLNNALIDLGYADHDQDIDQARYKLMSAEGKFEYNYHSMNASHAFATARKEFRDALNPVIEGLVSATQETTLMGVVSVPGNSPDMGPGDDEDEDEDQQSSGMGSGDDEDEDQQSYEMGSGHGL